MNHGSGLSGIYGGFRNFGYFLGVPGVPIISTIVFWGLDWGPLISGSYHTGTLVYQTPFLVVTAS